MNNRTNKPVNALVLLMLLSLIIAGGWGIILLISIVAQGDLKAAATGWVHMHGIMQLWGWTVLAIFGASNILLRQSTGKASLGFLNTLATAAYIFGISNFLFTTFGGADMLKFSAGCLLAAAIFFSLNLLFTITATRRGLDLSQLFALAAAQWAVIWASTDLFARIRFAGAPILPDYIRNLLLTLSVLGFSVNFIFGLGLRILPGLLKTPPLKIRAGLLALVAYNAGVIFLAGSLKIGHVAAFLGGLTLLSGTLLYLAMLNFLRSVPTHNLSRDSQRSNTIIRLAFLFFVIALLMLIGHDTYAWAVGEPHRAYTSALRHLLTVGFIATLIVGVGHRLVALSLKPTLITPRLFQLASILLVGGCLWRVIAELFTITGERWIFYVMGPSGLFELAGLLLFALTVLRALIASRHMYRAGDCITAATRAHELLSAQPNVEATFHSSGIQVDSKSIAPSVSIGTLAASNGADLEAVLLLLNSR